MLKKRLALIFTTMLAGIILPLAGCNAVAPESAPQTEATEEEKDAIEDIALTVTALGNPVTRVTGGDPSAFTDGEKVYLYSGHDVSTDEEVSKSIYNIPEYLCYSSEDMKNWTEEGVVMTMDTVDWAADDVSAWASQVISYKDKYYLYFCSWEKNGKQSIGVAISDSPTGSFVDIGEPLVRGTQTKPDLSTFNDIDPTVWVETDENGEEHRYLAWGNGVFFVCELNEDMISVKDINGDGEITCGLDTAEADIIKRTAGLESYTEAPWIYRRSDGNGGYTGPYYVFFAHEWHESMAYATTDDLLSGEWSDTVRIMYPTVTSNTNHPAVIDFKDKTYFIGHNGALPGGSGYRRSVTVQELIFNEDGSIDLMEESASGLSGETVSILTADGEPVVHEAFVNSASDSDYPYKDVMVGIGLRKSEGDGLWVLRPGKSDNGNKSLVSIESENKPGLYITVSEDGTVNLAQDTDATDESAASQTFHSYRVGGDDSRVILESVSLPGKYLLISEGVLHTGSSEDAASSPFSIE